MLSIDLRQVYDRVNREPVYTAMMWLKAPEKIVKLTEITLKKHTK